MIQIYFQDMDLILVQTGFELKWRHVCWSLSFHFKSFEDIFVVNFGVRVKPVSLCQVIIPEKLRVPL